MTDRLIRVTTALAVATVAAVAAVIAYQHAYELVSTHDGCRQQPPVDRPGLGALQAQRDPARRR